MYFPLGHHFEQNFHVRHRLDRYRAGRCMNYATSTPDLIAHATAAEIDQTPTYLPVESNGTACAASLIAELL